MPLSFLIPFAARSQNMVIIAMYDELTSLLHRCRSCGATVEDEALFDVGISGSGAGAETILLTKRKRKFHVNVWYRVTNLKM